jgi:acetamidase/formamidase
VRRVEAEQFHGTFSRFHPILARIQPGEEIETTCLDSAGVDSNGVKRSTYGNPLTGPFFVEGAEPGDSIAVHFDKVRLNRDSGFSFQRLGLYALTPESIEGIYPADYRPGLVIPDEGGWLPWSIDRDAGTVTLSEPSAPTLTFAFRARPMLGCIGVAPAGDFAPTSGPSGAYGGNIDYNRIGEGATVHLPVYQPGALLFIGDGHALQGDGEPMGAGLETSMDVQFRVTVRHGAALAGPRLETAEVIASIGSQAEFASSMNRGLQLATSDMVDWLVRDYGLQPWEAHLLIGTRCRYEVVTALGSMAIVMSKADLPEVRGR